jgi:ribosomal-protein-alanine N-acetyltransferase
VNVVIRDATEADSGAIVEIQRESGGTPEWPLESYSVVVGECDGGVRGFLVTRQVASDEYEILDIAVAPAFRRLGVGRALLVYALELCRGVYFLEVRESNNAARRLYSEAGFEEVGTRPEYYSNPSESAVVMRKRS